MGVDLSVLVEKIREYPEWPAIEEEITRMRDMGVRRLVQCQGTHADQISIAGEVRGLERVLKTFTLKGQE